jgi:hypothetical protein
MTDTPTITPQPIVVADTPSALPKSTKPDDLLDMYDAEAAAAKPAEAPKETDSETSIPPTEPKEPSEKAPDGPSEATQVPPEQENQEIEAPTAIKGPVIKGKLGDSEVKIPEEAEITQQINGKDVTFKVRDAVESFVKKEEIFRAADRRISIADKKEKGLQAEYSSLKGRANQVVQAAMSGDFMSTVRALAKIAAGESQLDVVKFEKEFLDQIEAFKAPYTNMTQEQREKFFAERRAKVYEEENKQLRESNLKREALGSLQSRIDSVVEQAKVSKDEFWQTFKTMADSMVGPDKPLKDANEIAPEDVAAQVALNRHAIKVGAACDKAGLDDAGFDKVFDLLKDHQDLNEDDILKIIKDSGVANTQKKVVEDLNRRVAKSGNKAQFYPQGSSTKKNGKIDGLDDEDMKFLYRMQPKQIQRVQR